MKFYKADSAGNMTPFEGDGQIRYDETLTASQSLTVNDSGKVFLIGTDALVITLPSTVAGLEYTFINSGADGAVGITIEPAAADKLMGSFNQNGSVVTMSGTDDKGIVNTKGTANNGDILTIIGDGDDGWYIKDGKGIWTEESQTVKSASFVDGVFTIAIEQSSDDYSWLNYSQWSTGADMPAGGSYGAYFKANVGHTVQNVIGGKGAIKFLTLADDESINYGAGFEATLELDDVATHTITVTDHISALNLYFDGSSKVEGVGGGAYSKMNLSRALWNSTTNFSIETNGYQVETAANSYLDYGFNCYNDGTMIAGLWIHNNAAHGTMVSDIKLSSGAKVFTGSATAASDVYAIVGTDGAIGSIFLSTTGSFFVQAANAGASTDWKIVTQT